MWWVLVCWSELNTSWGSYHFLFLQAILVTYESDISDILSGGFRKCNVSQEFNSFFIYPKSVEDIQKNTNITNMETSKYTTTAIRNIFCFKFHWRYMKFKDAYIKHSYNVQNLWKYLKWKDYNTCIDISCEWW